MSKSVSCICRCRRWTYNCLITCDFCKTHDNQHRGSFAPEECPCTNTHYVARMALSIHGIWILLHKWHFVSPPNNDSPLWQTETTFYKLDVIPHSFWSPGRRSHHHLYQMLLLLLLLLLQRGLHWCLHPITHNNINIDASRPDLPGVHAGTHWTGIGRCWWCWCLRLQQCDSAAAGWQGKPKLYFSPKAFHVIVSIVEMRNQPCMKLMALWEGHTFILVLGLPFFRAKAMSSARVRSAFGERPPAHLLCTLFLTARREQTIWAGTCCIQCCLPNCLDTNHSARCSCILFWLAAMSFLVQFDLICTWTEKKMDTK